MLSVCHGLERDNEMLRPEHARSRARGGWVGARDAVLSLRAAATEFAAASMGLTLLFCVMVGDEKDATDSLRTDVLSKK